MTQLADRWQRCLRACALSVAAALASIAPPFGATQQAAAQNPSSAERPSDAEIIDKISAYMNSVKTISGKFRQIEPGPVFRDGQYAIRRPGRMFFRYDPPDPVRIVADGFWVATFDEIDDPSVDRLPLSETPLHVLLKEDVNLRKEKVVKSVRVQKDFYRVLVHDPSNDVEGDIELVFDRAPLRLREWTVTEPDGYTTTVVLRTAIFNKRVDPALFVIETTRKDRRRD